MLRHDIINEARSWVGTPFEHHGRDKGKAVDCLGLIVGIGKALGLTEFDTFEYEPDPHMNMHDRYFQENLNEVFAPELGCIALLKIGKHPRHFGILVNRPQGAVDKTAAFNIIHADGRKGYVVEVNYDHRFSRMTKGWYLYG